MNLKIEFQTYWICGSGAGTGNLTDSTCERDSSGIPFVPGRHLKGMLRDAVRRRLDWAHADATVTSSTLISIFGDANTPATLRVSNGRLNSPEIEELLKNRGLIPHMFRQVSSTAVTEGGVAQKHSLRTIEVAIPLTLYAGLEGMKDGLGEIRSALPLITNLGSHRQRGFGEVRLSLEENL